jgi:hypothetical protein
MALGAEAGEVQIHVAGNSTSSSILDMLERHERSAPESAYVGSEQVTVHRLDDVRHPFLEQARTPFLKIDTQGYEAQVLQGAAASLPRICGIQIELSLVPLYAGQTLYREMIDHLVSSGFDLWGIKPGFMDMKSGRLLQFDGLFFRSR